MGLTKELVQEALDKCDGNIKKAVKLLGHKYQSVYYYISKYNLKYKSEKPLIDPTNVQELYNRLGSLSAVAKELGSTKEGIRCLMKRMDMQISPLVRYDVDHEFFSKDNHQSFYWAG